MKIKAFTIIETLFTLVLSAIVVSIFYGVYLINIKNFTGYNTKSSKLTEIRLFKIRLTKDFDAADQVYFDTNLAFYKNDSLKSMYSFNNAFITRTHNNAVDSFKITTQDISKSFIELDARQPLLSKLAFIVSHNSYNYNFVFSKDYDSKQLILWNE